jgi:hypothetical protein
VGEGPHFHAKGGLNTPIPYEERGIMQLTPAGEIWFALARTYRLYRLALNGDTTRIVERADFESVPVTKAEMDSIRVVLKSYIDRGVQVDFSRIPKTKHALTTFTVDDRGNLWVQAVVPHDQGTPWDVFDPVGRYLGRVQVPVAVASYPRLLIRGDHFYAPTSDANGNLTVVICRIVRPSP